MTFSVGPAPRTGAARGAARRRFTMPLVDRRRGVRVVSMDERRRELSERLGRYRTNAGRELRALAQATADEQIVAAVYAVWRWRAWIVAATGRGLHLSRRPRLFGRNRSEFWAWSDVQGVRAGPQRIDLVLGDETVELRFIAPHREFVLLADAARRAASGSSTDTRSEDLRDLAKRKLGRTLAFFFETTIDSLPDRLLDDERVERVAGARLDFHGLLAVTNRRVVLFDVPMRRAKERFWEVDRDQILGAEAVEDGLRLELGSGTVTFTHVLPDERREELAAALWRG
jgi:hypothetical protein